MSQVTNVQQVKLNIMTEEQYGSIIPNPTEFYVITDAPGVTYAEVIAALGYTPYDSTNPEGYISGITSSDVVTALGYTPYDSTNPEGYISEITSDDVTTALGYTPYDATNPEGYISGITSADVTAALGYTPYNATNPEGYISSAAIATLTDVELTNVANGQILTYDLANNTWKNTSAAPTSWGSITGDITDQTDLQQALDGKQEEITGAASTITASNLALDRALVSDSNGKVGVSSITVTKLNYLSDVSSNIQVQLNSKQPLLTSENAGAGISITTEEGVLKISNTQTSAEWGNITGTLADQTDLKEALDSKASVTIRDWSAA